MFVEDHIGSAIFVLVFLILVADDAIFNQTIDVVKKVFLLDTFGVECSGELYDFLFGFVDEVFWVIAEEVLSEADVESVWFADEEEVLGLVAI